METMKRVKKEKSWRMPRRDACPMCGCKELLTEGPDQFCVSCDWDTCSEYVERGLMNNLGMAYVEHFVWDCPAKPKKPELELASAFIEDAAVEEVCVKEDLERVG